MSEKSTVHILPTDLYSNIKETNQVLCGQIMHNKTRFVPSRLWNESDCLECRDELEIQSRQNISFSGKVHFGSLHKYTHQANFFIPRCGTTSSIMTTETDLITCINCEKLMKNEDVPENFNYLVLCSSSTENFIPVTINPVIDYKTAIHDYCKDNYMEGTEVAEFFVINLDTQEMKRVLYSFEPTFTEEKVNVQEMEADR